MRVLKALGKQPLSSPGDIRSDSALKSEKFAVSTVEDAVIEVIVVAHNACFHSNAQKTTLYGKSTFRLENRPSTCTAVPIMNTVLD